MDMPDKLKLALEAKTRQEQAAARPLLDLDAVKTELFQWLAELKLPAEAEVSSWEELVREFPAELEDKERTGVRVRLALGLCTKENRYLISIMECLDVDSRGVYLISAHVNWKADELKIQKKVDEGYLGHFDDVLRAKHALWAQTFRLQEFTDALGRCAIAILGHELVHRPDQLIDVESIVQPRVASPSFPEPTDELG